MNSEFGKYAEDDDEDYEDVFGKANGNGGFFFLQGSASPQSDSCFRLAAEQPMQTLQLTTRLSNRSWVRL